MGTLTLNDKQQRRAEILSRVINDTLTTLQAAQLLRVTERQVRRLLQDYKAKGLASVVHGNTGRAPANKTAYPIRDKLSSLAGQDGKYRDFNACHLQEMLTEREDIKLGRSTLDRLLTELGVRKRKRGRPRRIFRHRERKPREGEMLLTDASLHDWLEGRDSRYKKLCLIGAIDDATSEIVHLHFWQSECQAGYITMAREVTVTFGIPMNFYHDRHTILCSPKEPTIEDELNGKPPMSRFQSILVELGAEGIQAMTPQAKGRIERMWQTLQDRLIKEMRLAGVRTMEEANAFLPEYITRYNTRFRIEARDTVAAWVKPETLDLTYFFAAKEERVVRADHTLTFGGQCYAITRCKGERSLAGERVNVHTTPEGERFIYHGKVKLRSKTIVKPNAKAISISKPVGCTSLTPDTDTAERKQSRKKQMSYLHTGVGTA
jgi:transposase